MPAMLSFISFLPLKTIDEISRKCGIIFAQLSLADELTSFLQSRLAAGCCQCYHHFAGICFVLLLLEVVGS